MTAQDIMNKNYKSIEHDKPVSKVLPKFQGYTEVVFVEKEGDYTGAIKHRDIFNTKNPDEMKVYRLKTNIPVVKPDASISECARLMIENDVMQLPVLNNGKIAGVVNDESILAAIPKDISKKSVKEYMTEDTITTNPSEKVSKIISRFQKNDISRMPVMTNDKLAGMITMHDAIYAFKSKRRADWGTFMAEKDRQLDFPVRDIMSTPVHTIDEDETVEKAIDEMLDKDINSLVVTRETEGFENFAGILTRKDILRPVAVAGIGLIPPMINVKSKVDGIDRSFVGDMITEYTEKNKHLLKRSMFNVFIGEHSEKQVKNKKMYARINVQTPAGRFNAYAEGWGLQNTVRDALQKIDKQIERKLDMDSLTRKKEFEKVTGQELEEMDV